jgi:hypothetical protein
VPRGEIELLAKLVAAMHADRLSEAATVKPLTPEQTRKRTERDRRRQHRIADVQASARRGIPTIRAEMGG